MNASDATPPPRPGDPDRRTDPDTHTAAAVPTDPTGPMPAPGRRTARFLADAEDMILGAKPRYTPTEVWRDRVGVPEELARNLWLAMGFAHVPDGEIAFTERDVAALRQAATLVEESSLDADRLRQQTRIMSQAMSTIATAHAEVLRTAMEEGSGAGLLGGDDPLPRLEGLLTYLYRRHLLAAVEQIALVPDTSDSPGPHGIVGFVDLTDFTGTSASSSEQELTDLVDDFAAVAADAVAAAGGRVVKLIGDEVMFSVEDPFGAAEVALGLVENRGDTAVHAGLARGTMVSHHGDLFGSTVNLASRLTGVARPGTVLVNDDLAAALAADDRYRLRRVHLRPLKGIGQVDAHVLRRATGDGDRRGH